MISDFDKNENREIFNKKFWYKTGGIVFVIVILLLVVVDFKIYQKKKELIAQIEAYEEQIEGIKKSSENLKEEIANADSPDYLEEIAYEQLGEQRPGEKQVVFVMPEEKQEHEQESKNFWGNFPAWLGGAWQWIKNRF